MTEPLTLHELELLNRWVPPGDPCEISEGLEMIYRLIDEAKDNRAKLEKIASEAGILSLQAFHAGAAQWAGGFGKIAAWARGDSGRPSAAPATEPTKDEP